MIQMSDWSYRTYTSLQEPRMLDEALFSSSDIRPHFIKSTYHRLATSISNFTTLWKICQRNFV